jgi:hypothetical protein
MDRVPSLQTRHVCTLPEDKTPNPLPRPLDAQPQDISQISVEISSLLYYFN